MEVQKIYEILSVLKSKTGVDFSGYRLPILERRIQKRILVTDLKNFDKYLEFIVHNPDEAEKLFDSLTLKVSHFFRNALTFEIIRKSILPDILTQKEKHNENTIRIWSAGCSNGEEPYSIAIILKEILSKKDLDIQVNIFATDVDRKSMDEAKKGKYKPSDVKNVKYDILNRYFFANGDNNTFIIDEEIKRMVKFSFFDLVGKNSSFPSESIYGGFDIVFCRNVLIYFDLEAQKSIFNKLYRSLDNNGYLVLGEAETTVEEFKFKFRRENNYCKVYRKTE